MKKKVFNEFIETHKDFPKKGIFFNIQIKIKVGLLAVEYVCDVQLLYDVSF